MPLLLLSELPAEQKPARIKGLIKRLFGNETILLRVPPENREELMATFCPPEKQEQVAEIYEKALFRRYYGTYQSEDTKAELDDIFKDIPNDKERTELSGHTQLMIEKSFERIGTVHSHELKNTFMEAARSIAKKANTLQRLSKSNSNSPEITALITINRVSNSFSALKTQMMIAVMHLLDYSTLDKLKHLEQPLSLKDEINLFKGLLLNSEHFDNTLKQDLEISLFNLGLTREEVEIKLRPLINGYRNLFKQNPSLEQSLKTLQTPGIDLDRCISEFNALMDKPIEQLTTDVSNKLPVLNSQQSKSNVRVSVVLTTNLRLRGYKG